MLHHSRSPRTLALIIAATSGLALAAPTAAFASAPHSGHDDHSDHSSHDSHNGHDGSNGHGGQSGHDGSDHHSQDLSLKQVNLASDIPGLAKLTDQDLKNPWGLALRPDGGTIWTANQATDSSTIYSLPPHSDDVVKSPTTRVNMPGSALGPSGQVANLGNGFVLSNGTATAPAHFIFATLDGRIEAWSPTVDPAIGDAELKATVPNAGYTGLALASSKHGDQLYAANFVGNTIDIFDSAFKPVKKASWQFQDTHLPKGYMPFNAQELNGNVFVTYDTVDAVTGREGIGKGIGIVDEYDPEGHLLNRIATGGDLNAPWGLAIAPASWGPAAGSLLVGNFGDGRINVIAQHNGHFDHQVQSQLRTSNGELFSEPGLWGLQPGTAKVGGTDALFFSAGLNQEQNGLLGVLRAH